MKHLLSIIEKYILLSKSNLISENEVHLFTKDDVIKQIQLIKKAFESAKIEKNALIGVALDDPLFALLSIAVVWHFDAIPVGITSASSSPIIPIAYKLEKTQSNILLRDSQENKNIDINKDIALILPSHPLSSCDEALYFTFEHLNAFKVHLACDHADAILIIVDKRFDIILPLLARLLEQTDRQASIGLFSSESDIAQLLNRHQFAHLCCPISSVFLTNLLNPFLHALLTWGGTFPQSRYEADLLKRYKHEHIFGALFPIAMTSIKVSPTSKYPSIYQGPILPIWKAKIVDREYRVVSPHIVGQLVLEGHLPIVKYQVYPTREAACKKLNNNFEFVGNMQAKQKQLDNQSLLKKIKSALNENNYEEISIQLESKIKDQPPLAIQSIIEKSNENDGKWVSEKGVAAEVKGQPLIVPPIHLADALMRAVKLGNNIRTIDQTGNVRIIQYNNLLQKACCLLAGLRERGIESGSEIMIHVNNQEDLFTGLWCCILGGFIALPLLIQVNYSEQELKVLHWLLRENSILKNKHILITTECIDDLKSFLSVHHYHPNLLTIDECSSNNAVAQKDWSIRNEFLLLLTSGSSGTPKGVLLTHENIIAMSEGIRQTFHYQPQDITLNWLPLDHVGGLVQFHLRDVYLGCAQIHVATKYILRDPLRWLDLIDQYKVSVTWCANFAFSLVLENAKQIENRSWNLSCLHTIMNGGELITPEINHQFLTLLEKHQLKSTVIRPCFGMSETTSCIISADNFIRGSDENVHWIKFAGADQPILFCDKEEGTAFIEVGIPIPGVRVRIVDEHNKTYPEGVCGRIHVRGPQIMKGYYNNEIENNCVKTNDGWLKMGDLGFMINGRLVVTGREKLDIIINGRNIAAQEIEQVIESIKGIKYQTTAACAIRKNNATTDSLAIFFCKEENGDSNELLNKISKAVIENFAIHPAWIIPLEPNQVPRTAIGKLKHQELINRLLKGEYDHIANTDALKNDSVNFLPHWFFYPDWRREPLLRLQSLDKTLLIIEAPDALPLSHHLASYCRKIVTLAPDETRIRRCILEFNPTCIIYNCHLQVHLFSADEIVERFQKHSESILAVVTLLRELKQSHILFNVIANDSLYATGEETSVSQSYLYGFLQSLRQENSNTSIKHIDVLKDIAEWESLAADIICHDQDLSVAYRSNLRLVPILKQIQTSHYLSDTRNAFLVQKGAYVLIGGLGGIGTLLASYLACNYQAKLLLIGRTDLDHDLSSPAHLALKRIRQQSKAVIYKHLDATDHQALQKCIQEFEFAYDVKIKTVFNLVGDGTIAKTIENMTQDKENQNTAYLYSKIKTTLSIQNALINHPAHLVTFSSVNGFFGGASFKEYAGECSFQDAYMRWVNNHNHRKAKVIDWSIWMNVGMAENTPDYMLDMAKQRGFATITKREGIASFDVACRFDHPQILVGLIMNNAHIFSLVDHAELTLSLQVTCRKTLADPILKQIQNIVGESIAVEIKEIVTDKTINQHAVDPIELTRDEKILLSIWKELFSQELITIDDNFFSLGGDSILTIQFVARAHQQGYALRVNDIFTYKTIRHIAKQSLLTNQTLIADEALRGNIPITPIQAWFFSLPLVNRSHFNMSNVFLLSSIISLDQIENCLQFLIQHHDVFKARYQQSQDCFTAHYANHKRQLNLDTIDLSQSEHFDQAFEALYFKQQRKLNISQGPLITAAYIWRGREQEAWLLLTIHHLIIDGVSWHILSEDLSQLLKQASHQKPLSLPVKSASFQSFGLHLIKLANDQTWVNASCAFWLKQLQQKYSLLPHSSKTSLVKEKDLSVYEIRITKNVTHTFLKKQGQSQLMSFDDVLTTAVLWAIYQWTRKSVCAMDRESHGRFATDAFDVMRTIGWFTAIYPFIIDFEQVSDINEGLLLVKSQLANLKGREFEFGVVKYLANAETKKKINGFPDRQVCFNYLGQFNSSDHTESICRWLKDSLHADICEETEHHYLINIAAMMTDGEFIFGFKYSPFIHQKEFIEQFANHIIENIKSLILSADSRNNIDFALAGINHHQLNSLLDKVEFT